MFSGTLCVSLSLCSVGALSWCRGLFSGSNILVYSSISAAERQEICKGISEYGLLPKSGAVLVVLTRDWWCLLMGCGS